MLNARRLGTSLVFLALATLNGAGAFLHALTCDHHHAISHADLAIHVSGDVGSSHRHTTCSCDHQPAETSPPAAGEAGVREAVTHSDRATSTTDSPAVSDGFPDRSLENCVICEALQRLTSGAALHVESVDAPSGFDGGIILDSPSLELNRLLASLPRGPPVLASV